MGMIQLKHSGTAALTDQITDQIRQLIATRKLRAGYRMPSIRQFAREHGVSSFTVIAAYDRLVATGYLSSRRGSGFYVADCRQKGAAEPPTRLERAIDSLKGLGTLQGQKLAFAVPHLMAEIARKKAASDMTNMPDPARKVQPASFLESRIVEQGLRSVARSARDQLTNYGEPYGYTPLRETIVTRLAEIGIAASLHGVLTSHGASHAFDLIGRHFIRPGDVVLVDDPGYLILFRHLELLGARLIGIPRTPDGPDPDRLERAAREHKARLFFTNTLAQNPTGSSISLSCAHRILQLAERHDLTIVEDDAYGDLVSGPAVRLAALDQFRHVIYVGSFSKTISCNIRVGFIACRRELAEDLMDVKIVTGLTTCEANERTIHDVLTTGNYRKHIDRLHRLLEEKRDRAMRNLEACGLELFCLPAGGMFLWARAAAEDASTLAEQAAREGIGLVPGSIFRPHHETTPWLRFNAAFCDDPRMFDVLGRLVRHAEPH